MRHGGGIVNPIDLGKIEDLRKCRVALIQFKINEEEDYKSFNDQNFRFKEDRIPELKERIINKLEECKKEKADVAVFPEISVPIAALKDITECCDDKDNPLYFVGGLEYDEHHRNSSCVIIPGRDTEYRCAKMHRSQYDPQNMNQGKHVNCYINTGFGNFSVLVCYDFLSTSVLTEISGYLDMFFVVAYNKGVDHFDDRAADRSFDNYCYVLIVNTANYGGTCW